MVFKDLGTKLDWYSAAWLALGRTLSFLNLFPDEIDGVRGYKHNPEEVQRKRHSRIIPPNSWAPSTAHPHRWLLTHGAWEVMGIEKLHFRRNRKQ